ETRIAAPPLLARLPESSPKSMPSKTIRSVAGVSAEAASAGSGAASVAADARCARAVSSFMVMLPRSTGRAKPVFRLDHSQGAKAGIPPEQGGAPHFAGVHSAAMIQEMENRP